MICLKKKIIKISSPTSAKFILSRNCYVFCSSDFEFAVPKRELFESAVDFGDIVGSFFRSFELHEHFMMKMLQILYGNIQVSIQIFSKNHAKINNFG